MRQSSENIMQAINLSRQLLLTADLGGLLCEDKQCSRLYATVRECAGKIFAEAERERARHIDRGIWDKQDDPPGISKAGPQKR